MTLRKPAWQARSDRHVIESAIRAHAERLGLAADHVLDLVDLLPPTVQGPFSVDSHTGAAIETRMREIALDRPDLVRDPSALKLAPREAYDRFMRLVGEGRHAEAGAFREQHAQAIALAKPIAAREAQRHMQAREVEEHAARRRLEALTRARYAVSEDEKTLAHIEQTGMFPQLGAYPRTTPPTPMELARIRVRLEERKAEVAQLEGESAASPAPSSDSWAPAA